MKVSMKDRECFAHWFLIACASSEADTHSNKESKFNQMVSSEGLAATDINMSVVINGFEFSNLEDVFKRVEDHIEKKVTERLSQQAFDSLRVERIQDILNARNIEDLEYL